MLTYGESVTVIKKIQFKKNQFKYDRHCVGFNLRVANR